MRSFGCSSHLDLVFSAYISCFIFSWITEEEKVPNSLPITHLQTYISYCDLYICHHSKSNVTYTLTYVTTSPVISDYIVCFKHINLSIYVQRLHPILLCPPLCILPWFYFSWNKENVFYREKKITDPYSDCISKGYLLITSLQIILRQV